MKRSTERILTTHVGSLPRPPDLLEMIQAKEQGVTFDAEAYESRVKSAVTEVVKRQADSGIDIVADGEMGGSGLSPMSTSGLPGSSRARAPAAQATGPNHGNIWRFRNITNGRRRCPGPPEGRRPPNGCVPARSPTAGTTRCSATLPL